MTNATKPLIETLSLNGKTALISGGANGIGLAIAFRYAEMGANLILIDRNEKALVLATNSIKDKYPVSVDTHVLDLEDIDSITNFWKNLKSAPDILINNAGVFWSKKLEDLSYTDYDSMMNINTKSVVWMCKGLIQKRGKHGGTIINISSIEARAGMTQDMLVYAASKSAILAIGRALVKDYASHGWKINSILPGGINTPGTKAIAVQSLKSLRFSLITTGVKYGMRHPSKAMGNPDDIARAAVWLGTSASDYINGAEIVIDGGFLAV